MKAKRLIIGTLLVFVAVLFLTPVLWMMATSIKPAEEALAAGAGVLLVAILAHKGAAGFALGSTFRESSIAPRTRIPALGIFVCSTPAGVLLGGLATAVLGGGDSAAEAWFKAVAAGTFLYIATLDVVREEFFPGGSDRASRLSFAILGAGIMALVAIWM